MVVNGWVTAGIVVWIYMTIWYGVAVVKKRNDTADLAWGLGFGVVAWTVYFLSREVSTEALIVNILVTIWGVRLASHIFQRLINKEEDYRYATWRKEWKNFYWRSYWQIFMLQGGLMWIILLPVVWINLGGGGGWMVGGVVWLVGFWFEATADKQLSEFVKQPENKGKIMKSGLWKYSRHPNYFGEVTMWWGIWLMAVTSGGWITIVGPLAITGLIRWVSGVPLLEKKFEGNQEWEEYKKQTSVLIPWWKK